MRKLLPNRQGLFLSFIGRVRPFGLADPVQGSAVDPAVFITVCASSRMRDLLFGAHWCRRDWAALVSRQSCIPVDIIILIVSGASIPSDGDWPMVRGRRRDGG